MKKENHLHLTKEEAIRQHRKMWRWIAEEIEKEKEYHEICYYKKQYCNRYFPGYKIECYCFLCEYSCQKSGNKDRINKCLSCPLQWTNSKNLTCIGGYYGLITMLTDKYNRVHYANIIAELPEVEDV